MSVPCLKSCPWALLRKAWLSLLYFPAQISTHMDKIPLSLLFSRLSQPLPISKMLQSLRHLCGPALDLLQYVHVSPALGSPALDPALWMHLTSAEPRERTTSLNLLVIDHNPLSLALLLVFSPPPHPLIWVILHQWGFYGRQCQKSC